MYFVRAESLTKESQKLSTIQLWAKRMPKDKVNKSGRQMEDADADAFALTYLSHSIFRLQNCTWKRADAIKCGHLFDSILAWIFVMLKIILEWIHQQLTQSDFDLRNATLLHLVHLNEHF